jgi:DNA helicase-2/ATP-dependent DNA helicase PcrA
MMMEEVVYFAVDLAKKLEHKEFLEEPKYIFVDEYQDLNRLEQEFVDILGHDSKLLLVVGDPDQSIYSFKHAYPEGIAQFAARPDVESHDHLITGRCPKKIVQAARDLLSQSNPEREAFIECRDSAEDGEIHFIHKSDQGKEFEFVVNSIAQWLRQGVPPKQILVLVPRRKLGSQFVEYAMNVKSKFGIPAEVDFTLALRPDFDEAEQEKILLLGLLVKRDSLLHIRSYLGIGDDTNYAKEVSIIKERYNGLISALEDAAVEHWTENYKRVRHVCARLSQLRGLLNSFTDTQSAEVVLDSLFPEDSRFGWLRNLFRSISEPEDPGGGVPEVSGLPSNSPQQRYLDQGYDTDGV